MNRERDVAAFEKRAPGYEDGRLGRMHREIADRTLDLALRCVPAPGHVLDVGCGTGYLLRQLAIRVPTAVEIAGIDAAPEMIRVADAASTDTTYRCPGRDHAGLQTVTLSVSDGSCVVNQRATVPCVALADGTCSVR